MDPERDRRDPFTQAAQCKDPAAQALLLHRIDDMSAEVAGAGISLKYSKKVCVKYKSTA